jgi:hypothetical protein
VDRECDRVAPEPAARAHDQHHLTRLELSGSDEAEGRPAGQGQRRGSHSVDTCGPMPELACRSDRVLGECAVAEVWLAQTAEDVVADRKVGGARPNCVDRPGKIQAGDEGQTSLDEVLEVAGDHRHVDRIHTRRVDRDAHLALAGLRNRALPNDPLGAKI